MRIPYTETNLILEEAYVKPSPISKLKDVKVMMVVVDDINEFKRLFLEFSCVNLLDLISHLEGSHILWYTLQEQLIGNIN